MKFKILLYVVFVVIILGGVSFFEQVLHPSIVDDIAVAQLENSEEAAMVMRGYDQSEKYISLAAWVGVIFVGIGLFGNDLVTFVSEKFRQCTYS